MEDGHPRVRKEGMSQLKLAELIGSLSYALDLTEGQPAGHCVRCCWIGMHVGRQIGLRDEELWSLYYTLLLKDLGCSSNAARICELYLTDDRSFKHDFKRVGTGTPQVLAFVVSRTGPHASWRKRVGAILNIMRNGDAVAQELIQTRCSRGADIARQLRFPESVAQGVHGLDEHFDGSGRPDGLQGGAIPLGSRIALLAQVVDVFHFNDGPAAALAEARSRAGDWFDPELVDALDAVAATPDFWRTLASDEVERAVQALEPGGHGVELDDDYLDAIADAYGQVVDAKSPFTAGHSQRVRHYTDLVASELNIDEARRRWLRRAAVLHDVGKLGVSNTILDKPARLDAAEWAAVQLHATYTGQILERISPFAELARVSSAHHERLDGTGYPLGLSAHEIALETRIITVADIFDAITAERPYHAPTPIAQTLDIMRAAVGPAIDGDCFAALECVVAREAQGPMA
ncbi:HD-GYP domain-containing protein [Cognatiluteimonas profundi]|uniref:HD-GYP domain-containing protein n=1 Tax=Cognatiluteimonas profundi TaxID=2594501 RepID=UPI0018EF14DE|nr:HD domain-containing phosphohydrolase [Lysobacter profundi]